MFFNNETIYLVAKLTEFQIQIYNNKYSIYLGNNVMTEHSNSH
jgi:hypothetical protein